MFNITIFITVNFVRVRQCIELFRMKNLKLIMKFYTNHSISVSRNVIINQKNKIIGKKQTIN